MINVLLKSNWTNKEIKYLKNVSIVEYDLQSGGLNIIKQFKLLPQEKINQLESFDKEKRNIAVGKLQIKDKDFSKKLVECFGTARSMFIEKNNIPDTQILSIKKDAIFLINCFNINGKVSEFLNFRNKNRYSSYMRINEKEFYFSADKDLDVKGLSEEAYDYQKDFLLADIKMFLNQNEKITPDILFNNLVEYRRKYLNKELPLETYRNLDTGVFEFDNFSLKEIDESLKDNLDISYNYKNYLMPFFQIIMNDILA